MATKKQATVSLLTILDAVETLSKIADIKLENFSEDESDESGPSQSKELRDKAINWLRDAEGLGAIKNLFRVVLNYLKNFYKHEFSSIRTDHSIEGVKTIMVLVGEAAKKLDHLTELFYKSRGESVTQLEEYRELQEFYQKRISNKVDENVIGKWILGLSHKVSLEPDVESLRIVTSYPKIDHVYVELETVKKDTEYELFLLRKIDGSRFFNARLIRNMKLVSDFGKYLDSEDMREELLLDFQDWKDRIAQSYAHYILKFVGEKMDRFIKETAKNRKAELPGALNSALMALMLCSYTSNRLINKPVKSCYEYFQDFETFLYQALQSREYQKFIVFEPHSINLSANIFIELTHALCKGFFFHQGGYYEILPIIQELMIDPDERSDKVKEVFENLGSILLKKYELMSLRMKAHVNGPLILLLKSLEDGECNGFCPLRQGNFPLPLFSLYNQDKKIINIRLPAPILQYFINKVHMDELFFGFLRSIGSDQSARKHLIVNLQDKTSWREAERCNILENLEKNSSFVKEVGVITLASDTEFYHQSAPYDKQNSFEIFKEQFYEHLFDDNSGCYFSDSMKSKLFPGFIKQLMDAIHWVFFANKKEASRECRQNFIDIYYYFLILKIIEIEESDSYSLTCKDSIDIGGSFNLMFYVMSKFVNQEKFTKADLDCIDYITYVPALIIRERLLFNDRFRRFVGLIDYLEKVKRDLKEFDLSMMISEAFDPLFQSHLSNYTIVPYHLRSSFD